MGFKKLSSKTPKNEKDFVDLARGETSNNNNNKRNKKLMVNFTEEEYKILNQEASSMGLGLNSYVRFKIFSKNSN
ncbi:hypothetical protein [Campylobacter sp.]|uniref:hypothetical protein n=1 Tax=Campylobacter sp. TaxID=205 RepID=UPI0025C4AB5A|nr:hypothetical protein [Campylobacter sp.]